MALVAATTRNNALGVANLNTVGISNCGHPTIPLLGSTTTRVEGAAVHRLGDVGQNCGTYTMVLGSSDTRVNT